MWSWLIFKNIILSRELNYAPAPCARAKLRLVVRGRGDLPASAGMRDHGGSPPRVLGEGYLLIIINAIGTPKSPINPIWWVFPHPNLDPLDNKGRGDLRVGKIG